MAYQRLILHYGFDQTDFIGVLSPRAVKNCWFELHRLGGCGAGEIRLDDNFLDRDEIEPGHWIACEYETGDRWYLGRVEQVQSDSPAGIRIQMEGAGIELNEVFPGAFSPNAQGVKPHLYARSQIFSHDPDRSLESVDSILDSAEMVQKLVQQYVVPQTKIKYVPGLIEAGPLAHDVTSAKFRGEESVRSIVKELAVRARNASWGVDAEGQFFFLQPNSNVVSTYAENQNLTRLRETRSRDLLFNRIVLTGDYVYDQLDNSGQIARRSFRWRGNYRQPASIADHGEHRIRMWVPWIRTQEDSRSFVTEFFRIYSQPVARFEIETSPQSSLPVPWLGAVKLVDREGTVLSSLQPEKVRVQFDHEPRFMMELGPDDPRELWHEPPHDERWELPEQISGFGESDYSFSDPIPSSVVLSSLNNSGSFGNTSTQGGSTQLTSLFSLGSSSSTGSLGSEGSLGSLESLVSSASSAYGSSEGVSSNAGSSTPVSSTPVSSSGSASNPSSDGSSSSQDMTSEMGSSLVQFSSNIGSSVQISSSGLWSSSAVNTSSGAGTGSGSAGSHSSIPGTSQSSTSGSGLGSSFVSSFVSSFLSSSVNYSTSQPSSSEYLTNQETSSVELSSVILSSQPTSNSIDTAPFESSSEYIFMSEV